MKSNLIEILEEICDYRNPLQITYTVPQILSIVIIGALSNLKHMTHIEQFAKINGCWFKNKLDLSSIPTHDTLSRVISRLDYREIDAALTIWLEYFLKDKQLKKLISKKVKGIIAIDGKKSHRNSVNRTTIVRAILTDFNQLLGSVKIPEYNNEIRSMSKLIKKLDLKGYLVTIDAIGTQLDLLNLLLSKKGHYLLPVKRNQPNLYNEIYDYVIHKIESNDVEGLYKFATKGHGREEKHISYTFYNLDWLRKRNPKWKSINSIAMIIKKRIAPNVKTSSIKRLYISDLKLSAKEFIFYTREHWKIENNLHRSLNHSFKEKEVLYKSNNCITNISIIFSFCIGILYNCKNSLSLDQQKLIFAQNLNEVEKVLLMS